MRRLVLSVSPFVFVLSSAFTAMAGQIYWSTGFGQTIERANLDGTNRQVVVHTPNLPTQLALDAANNEVYWTGVQGRGVWRAGLDGEASQKLISPAGNPKGIALDRANRMLYWAEGPGSSRIMRADTDGTAIQTLITTPTGYPEGLTLDLIHNQMYWMNVETDAMFRSNLDGTETVQLLTTGVSPIDLALDLPGRKVYWTENGASYPAYDVIKRANLDGSNIETIVTGLWNPLGIALDPRAGKVYWADHDHGMIQRANLDGSGVENVLTGLADPEFIALDVPEPTSLLLSLFAGAIGGTHNSRFVSLNDRAL